MYTVYYIFNEIVHYTDGKLKKNLRRYVIPAVTNNHILCNYF